MRRNVYLLGITSFLNDVSSEIIAPILPFFILSLGGNAAVVGLIAGLRDSIASILKVFSGFISDRLGKRKILVVTGYLTSALFKLALSFAKIWHEALAFLSFERIGKGIRTAPRDALIAESLKQRGLAFGIHRALDTLGAVVGAALAFLLVGKLNFSYTMIILFAAIISFSSLLPLLFVKEPKMRKQKIKLLLSMRKLPKKLKLAIGVVSLFTIANFSYMFFLMKAKEIAGLTNAILLYLLFNIFYAALAIPFGKLADRFGKQKILALGYGLFALTAIGFILAPSLVFLLFALYGVVYAIVDANQRALIADLSPANLKATALGAYHTAVGIIALPSSLIAGLIWQISPAIVFGYAAAIASVAGLLMLRIA